MTINTLTTFSCEVLCATRMIVVLAGFAALAGCGSGTAAPNGTAGAGGSSLSGGRSAAGATRAGGAPHFGGVTGGGGLTARLGGNGPSGGAAPTGGVPPIGTGGAQGTATGGASGATANGGTNNAAGGTGGHGPGGATTTNQGGTMYAGDGGAADTSGGTTGTIVAPDLSGRPITLTMGQRLDAVDAAKAYWDTLTTLTPEAERQALVAYLQAQSVFADAGSDATSGSVWARFSDGLPVIFMQAFPGLAPAPVASPGSEHLELPGADLAEIVDIDGLSGGAQDSVAGYLAAQGYNLLPPSTGALEDLRSLKNISVLYVSSHSGGGVGRDGKAVTAVASSSWVSAAECTPGIACDDDSDYTDGHLSIGAINRSEGNRWLVLPSFIQKYWTFASHSLAFLDGCSTGGGESGDLRAAVQGAGNGLAGATNVVGWTSIVSTLCASKVRMFFDRVLGARDFEADVPPDRPFDYASVLAYMKSSGKLPCNFIDAKGPGSADLVLFGSSDILVPSIERLEVDEDKQELTIHGDFGTSMGSVTVGSAAVDVHSWGPDVVVTSLNPSGAGSQGDVIVKVRDHQSNAVPLTSWRGQVIYESDWPSFFGIKHTVTCNLHFRADVHLYRSQPGKIPSLPNAPLLLAVPDSTCIFNANSTGTSATGQTITLTGNGGLPWCSNNVPKTPKSECPGGDYYFQATSRFDRAANTFTWALAYVAPITLNGTATLIGDEIIVTATFSSGVDVGGGTASSSMSGLDDNITWPDVKAECPPDDNTTGA